MILMFNTVLRNELINSVRQVRTELSSCLVVHVARHADALPQVLQSAGRRRRVGAARLQRHRPPRRLRFTVIQVIRPVEYVHARALNRQHTCEMTFKVLSYS